MPKVPMDYSKCCIYKIEHIDNESLVYVGHTTNFDKRKTQHKYSCKNEKDKKHNLKIYKIIRETGGWEMFKMIEVEKYPCNDRREAERRENEVIKELKASMNMINSFRTKEELKEYMKEYDKEYREANKLKLNEYKKEYKKNNKLKIQEYKKEYREANKSKINEKVKCECGCEIVKHKLKRHQATKKHLEKMKNIDVSTSYNL